MRKKSFRETETTYNNINDDILSHKYKILISNDAKGWSDVGPRCAWAKHHDYVFQTIKNAPNVKLENLWKNTRATINKRGYVNSFSATATMFQGFTGTMDSLLNDRITLFTVREARKLGLLGKGGYVRTAALIDDAIQAIFMAKETTLKDAQRLADQQFDITATVWKKLGAELDDVKTMISDNAFVYLNRFFCEGTETLPAYASCYARIDTADKPMFTIVSTKPTSRCSDLKSTSKNAYANWYDGRSKDGQRRPVKSSSTKIAHSPQYKLLSIAQKCIADGAALVGYVKDSLVAYPDDRSAECLWLLFCAGWMIEDINNAPDLGVSYKADAATKRIGIKANVLNHLLLPFPNARDCVTVDALPLMRYVDAIKTNIHAYAMIDCLKATMLIEAACSNESGHNLLFNLQSDALSLRSNITYEVDISLDFGILNRIKPKGNNVYKSLAMASVRLKIGGTCDDDEGIDFWISSRITPQDLGDSMGVIIRPGIITGDIMAPGTATKQYTTRHTSALIDEETFCKRSNIRTRIDKYMQTMDPNIALLTAMTDQVATELPVMCPNALMECTWQTCVGIVNELLPSATSVIQRAFKSINMYKRHFRIVVLEPIFRCPINELNAFKSPAKVDKLKIPHIVAHFTMFAYGRFPNSAMYSSAISKGAKHIRTIYKNRSMRKFARSRNVGDENHTLGILFRLLATHAAMPRTGKDAITSIMSCFADALDLSLLVQGKEAHDNASIKNVTGKEMHQTIEGAADLRILCLTVKLHATRVIDTSTGIFLSHALNMVVANYRSLVDGMIKCISTGVTEVYTVDEKFTSSVPGIEGEIVFKDCEVTTNVDNQWKQAVMSLAADLDYDAVRQVISTHTYDTNMILPIFNEEEFQEAISMVLR